MNNFDAKKVKDELVQWIRNFFGENGPFCNAVVGISGGVDSSVVAALCKEALGNDRVIGVLLPRGEQRDICFADMLCDFLGIRKYELNINEAVNAIEMQMSFAHIKKSEQTLINLPARIRMSTLYAVSQSLNGRVANTSNLSESWVGYDTRWGDSVGDFSPLAWLTKTEIRLIGKELGLPDILVDRTPTDGLCGKTDEQRFGFTYDVLDKYIRTGKIESSATKERIDAMHEKNLFKLRPIPCFEYN